MKVVDHEFTIRWLIKTTLMKTSW